MGEVVEARQILSAALNDGSFATGPAAASLAATIARTYGSQDEAAPLLRRALEEIIATPFLSAAQAPLAMIESVLSAPEGPVSPGLNARLMAARQHLRPPLQQPVVKIRTLGRPEVSLRGKATKASAALLAALKLGGELDRATLQLQLYPDRSASAAESAVKQDIFRTRKALGADSILSSGPHHNKHYALAPR
ncbi:hypothetical protein ACFSC4_25910 [Deinococcus malanensis]|uniref:hypothetical protein n=1 Tax=Deinococcus malanensis TaxID=1706855 RepID=UPI003639E5F5